MWFVSIHPYDDGNGRILRVIKHNLNTESKLYSISTVINSDRRAYYEILDKTTNLFLNRIFDVGIDNF